MSGCYVSPLPTRMEADYYDRPPSGWPMQRRLHVFTQADGRETLCRPRYCRECWRETHWHDHGEDHG